MGNREPKSEVVTSKTEMRALVNRVCLGVGSVEEGQKLRAYIEELESRVTPETSDELRAVCEEIRNKAQSSVGSYGLGNYVAIHRELLGSMCAILDRGAQKTSSPRIHTCGCVGSCDKSSLQPGETCVNEVQP